MRRAFRSCELRWPSFAPTTPSRSCISPTWSRRLAKAQVPSRSPTGYGRVIRDGEGRVIEIREQRDLRNENERAISEVNPGFYAARVSFLRAALAELRPNNAQQELYLTDVVEAAGKGAGAIAIPDRLWTGHPRRRGEGDRDSRAARSAQRKRARHLRSESRFLCGARFVLASCVGRASPQQRPAGAVSHRRGRGGWQRRRCHRDPRSAMDGSSATARGG